MSSPVEFVMFRAYIGPTTMIKIVQFVEIIENCNRTKNMLIEYRLIPDQNTFILKQMGPIHYICKVHFANGFDPACTMHFFFQNNFGSIRY